MHIINTAEERKIKKSDREKIKVSRITTNKNLQNDTR